MNKNLIILLLSVFTLASCTQKIAYVNSEKLIQDYDGTKKAEAELKVKSDKLQAEIKNIEAAFQAKVDAMKPAQIRRKGQELQTENGQIQQYKQQVQYTLQNESRQALQEVSVAANDFVKEYAKKNGYNFIFGTVDVNGAVLYGDEKADITYDVLKALNAKYKEDKDKPVEAKKDAKVETEATKKTEETKKETPAKAEEPKK